MAVRRTLWRVLAAALIAHVRRTWIAIAALAVRRAYRRVLAGTFIAHVRRTWVTIVAVGVEGADEHAFAVDTGFARVALNRSEHALAVNAGVGRTQVVVVAL